MRLVDVQTTCFCFFERDLLLERRLRLIASATHQTKRMPQNESTSTRDGPKGPLGLQWRRLVWVARHVCRREKNNGSLGGRRIHNATNTSGAPGGFATQRAAVTERGKRGLLCLRVTCSCTSLAATIIASGGLLWRPAGQGSSSSILQRP